MIPSPIRSLLLILGTASAIGVLSAGASAAPATAATKVCKLGDAADCTAR